MDEVDADNLCRSTSLGKISTEKNSLLSSSVSLFEMSILFLYSDTVVT